MNNRKIWTIIISSLFILSLIGPIIPDKLNPELQFDDELDVMTFNLHFGIDNEGLYSINKVINNLVDYEPDILFVQEITLNSAVNGYINFWSDLVEETNELGYMYNYLSEGNFYLSNGIISRVPLQDKSTIQYKNQDIYLRSLVKATIEVKNDNLDIYTTHLSHQSEENRLKQINELLSILSDRSNPVIFGGDFNLISNETGYDLITSDYNDVWGSSYNTTVEPGYTSPTENPDRRIDYLFSSNDLSQNNCQVIKTLASDHLPLLCQFDITI